MTFFKGSRAPTQHKSALLLPSLSYRILQNKSLELPYPQFIHFLAEQLILLCQSMNARVLTSGYTVQMANLWRPKVDIKPLPQSLLAHPLRLDLSIKLADWLNP